MNNVLISSENHGSNWQKIFPDFIEQSFVTDVTLMSEDKSTIKTHKVVLAAGSVFFKEIFSMPEQNPLIYLRGVSKANLESIVNFIYSGSAKIPQNKVNEFLEIAREFKINGLEDEEDSKDRAKNISEEATEQPSFKKTEEDDNIPSKPVTLKTEKDDFYNCKLCQRSYQTDLELEEHYLKEHSQTKNSKLKSRTIMSKWFEKDPEDPNFSICRISSCSLKLRRRRLLNHLFKAHPESYEEYVNMKQNLPNRLLSPIWNWFKEDENDYSKAICQVEECSRRRVSRGPSGTSKGLLSTTPLTNHLKHNHPSVFQEIYK